MMFHNYLDYVIIVISLLLRDSVSLTRHDDGIRHERTRTDRVKTKHASKTETQKPNIVIVMTDDQDEVLGSMNFMPKTLRMLRDEGSRFTNSFVTTPMCCPSRSSFLTGMYVHNHNVHTNNANCSSPQWQRTHETRNFATYLSKAGYRTGFFGKYLNEYNGTYIPPGWLEWVGLVHNSRFYNYSLNVNGKRVRHGFSYAEDYFTDLIANDSIRFFQNSKERFPNRPVLMVLTVPAPHGPEDSAPQYSQLFDNITTHRTSSWDYAPNPDKQWVLQQAGKMEPIHKRFTDLLQQKRLQTLQSVDDAVEKVYNELKNLGQLENSYIVYTSDHGYHLGQYGLLKGKSMPYEFDIRVPFFIRGPGVPQGISIPDIVLNLDLAPTFLDMAGVAIPDHMDGRSILKIIKDVQLHGNSRKARQQRQILWRDTFLVERGKVTKEKLTQRFNIAAARDALGDEKQRRLQTECERAEYSAPCNANQHWECKSDDNGTLSLSRCPHTEGSSYRDRNAKAGCAQTQDAKIGQKINQLDSKKSFRARVGSMDEDINYQYVVVETEEDQNLDDPFSFRQGEGNRSDSHPAWSSIQQHYEEEEDYVFEEWHTLRSRQDEMMAGYAQALQRLKEVSKSLEVQKREFPNVTHEMLAATTSPKQDRTTTERPEKCTECDKTEKPKAPTRATAQTKNKKKLTREERRALRREARKRGKTRKRSRRTKKSKPKKITKRNDPDCRPKGMECHVMKNDHWKTEPRWTYGPFCFCPNAQNNTYWCIRTLNDTHNFLYCEFITGFISYYDMTTDPHQLRNVVHELSFGVLQNLHHTLTVLQACQGQDECNIPLQPTQIDDDSNKPDRVDGSGDVSSGDATEESLSANCDPPMDKDAEDFLKITAGLRLDTSN